MPSKGGWRHCENQPAMSSINSRKFENISEEGSVGFWVFRIDYDMCAVNHEPNSMLGRGLIIHDVVAVAKSQFHSLTQKGPITTTGEEMRGRAMGPDEVSPLCTPIYARSRPCVNAEEQTTCACDC